MITAPQRLDLEADPVSVRQARAFVRRALQDWDLEDLVDPVTLLVSELATNAVLHARTRFAVEVSRDAEQVLVEVLDGSAVPPLHRHNSRQAATGRGVALVDELSGRWGVRPAKDGFAKAVWFTVPVTG